MESGPPRWTRRSAASSLAEDGDAPHALFRIDRAARERWVTLMERALDKFPAGPKAIAVIKAQGMEPR